VGISGNTAIIGGGIFNYSSSPVLTNVSISGNTTTSSGGGIYNVESSSPVLTNVTISGNTASASGGGIYNSLANPVIQNSIIWGNTAGSGLGISGSGWTAYNSNIQNESSLSATPDANDNIKNDPLFITTTIPTPPSTDGYYSLDGSSPSIDHGNSSLYPTIGDSIFSGIGTDILTNIIGPALQKDAAGNPRFNGTIDMGAYEY
jgi:hypothetical protein